jgi:Recombination endonuclease VII
MSYFGRITTHVAVVVNELLPRRVARVAEEIDNIEVAGESPIEKRHRQKREYQARYRLKHPDRVKKSQDACYAAKPEHYKAKKKEYREANIDKIRAHDNKYFSVNRDSINKKRREHRQENREDVLAKQKAWRLANPEKVRALKKAWSDANPDKVAAQKKRYWENNKERLSEKRKAEHKANPEKQRAYDKKKRDKHPEKMRDRHLRRSYGISLAEFSAMRQSQGDRCSICKTGFSLVKPHVDHCHKTGRVRGILCPQCNTSLGLLNEDPKIVRGMLAYINKHSA